MEGFKKGDRIICSSNYEGNDTKGKIGTIKDISHVNYQIKFDEQLNMGNMGWWIPHSYANLYNENILEKYFETKFKNRHAKVVKNGCIYKVIKSDGEVIVTYIQANDVQRFKDKPTKTEQNYIELFNEAIQEYKKSLKEEK